MKFIEFIVIVKRHKLLLLYGVLVAICLAIFSTYRLEGATFVSKAPPVYETTAVVAIKAGPEINLPTTEPATTTPTTGPIAAVPVPTPADVASSTTTTTTTTVTTTTMPPPPDDVIDSRSLYYAALSINTAVVAPGFSEQVRKTVDGPSGSISAVAALDTNTIRLTVTASTPGAAADTMAAALTQLQALVRSYADAPSVRYTLDSTVISPPSEPSPLRSIKGPLTVVLVFGVSLVLLWIVVRAVDIVRLHRREIKQLKRAQAQRALELRDGCERGDPMDEPDSRSVSSP